MLNTLFVDKKILFLEEVNSTNEFAKSYIKNNLHFPEGTTIVANHQPEGKGQRGNSWESEPGKNLTFSVMLSPKIFAEHQFQLSKIVALSIIDFLFSVGVKNAQIKWPNDIYIENKKIAGILIENNIKENKLEHTVVGIGININQKVFTLSTATSLYLNMQIAYDLKTLLYSFLEKLEKRYFLLKTNQHNLINEAYLANLLGYNKELTFLVNATQTPFLAKIVGVSATGKLQLKQKNKTNIEEFDVKELKLLL